MRVAVHRCFPGFDLIGNAADLGMTLLTSDDQAEFAELAAGADVLVVHNPGYTKQVADSIQRPGAKTRFIQFVSAGFEHAEFFGAPRGALISNGSTVWAPVVAEHAVALLLGLLRRMPQLERMRAGATWDRTTLMPALVSLDGLRVGILGHGTIGEEIARRLKPFGAEIIGIARSVKPVEHADRLAPLTELPDLLPTLGALISAVPSGPRTLKMVDAAMLAQLPPNAVFVNVGRGATVDEAALHAALTTGKLAAAGLDVFETEPLPATHSFWSLDNVILSPHIAGFGSAGTMRRAHHICRENLSALRDGKPLLSQVFLS